MWRMCHPAKLCTYISVLLCSNGQYICLKITKLKFKICNVYFLSCLYIYQMGQWLSGEIKSTHLESDLALGPFVVCIREWQQGGARLPTTRTLVKLTLCNGGYLIIENSRGKKSGQPMLRGKNWLSGSSSPSARLLLAEELLSYYDLPSLC